MIQGELRENRLSISPYIEARVFGALCDLCSRELRYGSIKAKWNEILPNIIGAHAIRRIRSLSTFDPNLTHIHIYRFYL